MKHPILSQSVNRTREERLCYRIRKIVKQFQEGVIPLLGAYGLLDEKHVKKYLRCDSFKAIYDDIIADEEKERLFKLLSAQGIDPEKQFKYTTLELPDGESEYIVSDDTNAFGHPIKLIRENTKRVEKSRWNPIPGAEYNGETDRDGKPLREVLLSFISYKGGALIIDFAAIREESYYRPTEAQCKVYDAISNCLDTLKSYGIKGYEEIRGLVVYDRSKGVIPFAKEIMCHKRLRAK